MKTRRAFFSTFSAIVGAAVSVPVLALPTTKSKSELQQELLDDALVVYRIGRAPERRIYRIDSGSMTPARAHAHLERMKHEIVQRRIPMR
jgi:hypothetical protein